MPTRGENRTEEGLVCSVPKETGADTPALSGGPCAQGTWRTAFRMARIRERAAHSGGPISGESSWGCCGGGVPGHLRDFLPASKNFHVISPKFDSLQMQTQATHSRTDSRGSLVHRQSRGRETSILICPRQRHPSGTSEQSCPSQGFTIVPHRKNLTLSIRGSHICPAQFPSQGPHSCASWGLTAVNGVLAGSR